MSRTGKCMLGMILALSAEDVRAASPVSLVREAQLAFGEGRFDAALDLYEQARDETDGDLSVLYNIALCQLSLARTDESIRTFENVAAKANLRVTLRQDVFYNIGVLHAQRALTRLDAILHPTPQPAADDGDPPQTQPATPSPIELSIEELQVIADELLTAIGFFRRARDAGADSADIYHNIRAARATRREVLGRIRLAQAAAAEKEKEDALKDPQAYLTTLIQQQQLQAGVSRRLVREPDENPNQRRRQRRVALRLQRTTMDRTATLVDYLENFTETEEGAANAQPTTQLTESSPREQLYREAAKRLAPVIDRQRDACAYLLDGELAETRNQQVQALETLRAVETMFPVDPVPALARWHGEQRRLMGVVDTFETPGDWLRDPLLPRSTAPAAMTQSGPAAQPVPGPDAIPLHDLQRQIGRNLARLAAQARAVAAQPPLTTSAPPGETDPRMDPEINKQLAEVLAEAEAPQARALTGIADTDPGATRSAQDELAGLIRTALDLFPKSLEQRLQELITRQAELNGEVAAISTSGDPNQAGNDSEASWKTEARDLASQLQSLLASPELLVRDATGTQESIDQDTRSVEEEVKSKATAAAGQGGTQDPQVQAFLEASRHLGEADRQMLAAIEELKLAAVEAAVDRLGADGPVQAAQQAALEALMRALEALNPNRDNEQKDQPDPNDEPQQEQHPQPRQDIRRAMQRLDQQREQAQQRLYQPRPRQAIKDW